MGASAAWNRMWASRLTSERLVNTAIGAGAEWSSPSSGRQRLLQVLVAVLVGACPHLHQGQHIRTLDRAGPGRLPEDLYRLLIIGLCIQPLHQPVFGNSRGHDQDFTALREQSTTASRQIPLHARRGCIKHPLVSLPGSDNSVEADDRGRRTAPGTEVCIRRHPEPTSPRSPAGQASKPPEVIGRIQGGRSIAHIMDEVRRGFLGAHCNSGTWIPPASPVPRQCLGAIQGLGLRSASGCLPEHDLDAGDGGGDADEAEDGRDNGGGRDGGGPCGSLRSSCAGGSPSSCLCPGDRGRRRREGVAR